MYNLKNNKSHNIHLQASWNKYGEDSFIWSILEYCSSDKRFEREQYYIDCLKPQYNFTTSVIANAGTSPASEVRKKISDTLKRKYSSKEISTYKQDHAWIKCFVYNAYTFEFVKEFKNIVECCKFLNIKSGRKERVFDPLILNKYVVSPIKFTQLSDLKNYIFSRRKIKLSPSFGDRYLVSEINNNIEYYGSITECAKFLGISKSMIMKNLNATKDFPYVPTKLTNCKIYFIDKYIPFKEDAVSIKELSEELSGNIGKIPGRENPEINSKIKKFESLYSVEGEPSNWNIILPRVSDTPTEISG